MMEARKALRGYSAGGRVDIDWQDRFVSPELEMPKSSTKILLNLALVATESMPRGGRLTLEITMAEGHHQFQLHGEGPRISISDAFVKALQETDVDFEITPKLAPAALVGRVIEENGGKISLDIGEERFFVVYST